MPRLRKIHIPGSLTLEDSHLGSGSPPIIVGSSGVWNDDSDSTYAELETFEHPDVSYADSATGTLLPRPVSRDASKAVVSARIRYQSLDVNMGPPHVLVSQPSLPSDIRELLEGFSGGTGSLAPTWLELPLVEASFEGMQNFLDRIDDGTADVVVTVFAPLLSVIPNRTPRTRIFEVILIVQAPGDAPPCRIFPTRNGLGLGAGANYPPDKSQQRSNRGVGYY